MSIARQAVNRIHRWCVPFVLSASALLLAFTPVASWSQNDQVSRSARQYKRVHQAAFKSILNGDISKAVNDLNQFLAAFPEDAESYYMLCVAAVQEGRLDDAVEHMRNAIERGLSPSRFAVASLGLQPLTQHAAMKELQKDYRHVPIGGPMLGCISGDSVNVWVRTMRESSVQVVASTSKQFNDIIDSPVVRTSSATDHTAVIPVKGLSSNRRYFYKIVVNGGDSAEKVYSFKTIADVHEPIQLRLAFGGGAGYVPQHEYMWDVIRSKSPDAFLLLGDNVYSDDPTTPQMQRYCYYRRQSRPEFRTLVSHVPVFTIWDDHDFGTNDCSGGPAIDVPAWKRPVYEVFRNNWVNPYYGGGNAQPGCYYDFYLGDIHFIMLDGRYYRNLEPQDRGRPTMLGPGQRRWLLQTISRTRGTLVVLCSPVPWVFEAKGDSKDTWNGFQDERKEIFAFLADNRVDGVILISADRHRSDLWKIERGRGYPLFEFNSSRLTNQHVHATMERAMFSYNEKQSFGLVEFDTTLANPTITYRIVNIDGETVFTHVFHRNQLLSRGMK